MKTFQIIPDYVDFGIIKFMIIVVIKHKQLFYLSYT